MLLRLSIILGLTWVLAACGNRDPDDPRQIDLGAAPDTVLLHLAGQQHALLQALNGETARDISTLVVTDVRLNDLRAPVTASLAPLSPAPVPVGYFELTQPDFRLGLLPVNPMVPPVLLSATDNTVMIEMRHLGGERSVVTWRSVSGEWKASSVIVTAGGNGA